MGACCSVLAFIGQASAGGFFWAFFLLSCVEVSWVIRLA